MNFNEQVEIMILKALLLRSSFKTCSIYFIKFMITKIEKTKHNFMNIRNYNLGKKLF